VILQQDAFDKIDASSPIERQKEMLEKVLEVCHTNFDFESFEEVNPYFKRVINIFKQMNYSLYQSEDFKKYETELDAIIKERKAA
jgi:V/A-type H+-transporting ATPase subunit A